MACVAVMRIKPFKGMKKFVLLQYSDLTNSVKICRFGLFLSS